MSETWSRGGRDASTRTPLQGGELPGQRAEHGPREQRHILLGVSHPSDDPARHRTFEVRAAFDEARDGWVAWAGEQNLNERRGAWRAIQPDAGAARVFPSAAACLGDAVTTIIAAVDREADETR